MLPPNNSLTGECYTGYQGILCADCVDGFSRSSGFKCSLCPEEKSNIARLFFIMLALALAIVLMVRSTLQGALNKNNVTSIYIKILMNHLQLVLLTSSFEFKWPEKVT
jgi:hypothetical protein